MFSSLPGQKIDRKPKTLIGIVHENIKSLPTANDDIKGLAYSTRGQLIITRKYKIR